jgi:E3 ubiquitin-protein ligase synoviolin
MYFPTMMALVHSKVFNVLLVNDALLTVTWLFYGLRRLCFGTVREQEWEGVAENMTYQVIQSLFALSYFHFTLSVGMGALILLTLCAKAFHLLSSSRLDTLEQAAQISMKTHIRYLACIGTLFHLDLAMVYASTSHIMSHGFDVWVVIALDWALMLISSCVLVARFLIHAADRHLHRRSTAPKYYVTLVSTFLQCVMELAFFAVIWNKVGPPLHLLRDLYITVRTLLKTAKNVVAYRANCALVDRCAIPTEAEILRDPSCVICMEEMNGGGVEGTRTTRRLPCGHVFHAHCLYRFVEKDRTCPMCRRDFSNVPVHRPEVAPHTPPPQPAVRGQQQPPAVAAPVVPPGHTMPTVAEMEEAFQEYQRWNSERTLSETSLTGEAGSQNTTLARPLRPRIESSAGTPTTPNVRSAPTRQRSSGVGSMPGMSLGEVRAYREFHTRMAAALADLQDALEEAEESE